MFLILITYKNPIKDDDNEVDKHLDNHISFLKKYYDSKNFLIWGRKNPRTGSVILCTFPNRDDVERVMREDPFYTHEVANFEIVEFTPTPNKALTRLLELV